MAGHHSGCQRQVVVTAGRSDRGERRATWRDRDDRQGKLAAETTAQTGYVADYCRYYAGLADKIEGAELPIDKPDMHVYTRRMPIGVVAAVVPWNA